MKYFKNQIIEEIKKSWTGQSNMWFVGVDSTVTAVLINSVISKKLICVFVDTGLMREERVQDRDTL